MGIYEESISHYNGASANRSASELNEWIDGYNGADDALKGYLKSLNGGKATLSGFTQYCRSNNIALRNMSLGM